MSDISNMEAVAHYFSLVDHEMTARRNSMN